jgi:O-methyltransferase
MNVLRRTKIFGKRLFVRVAGDFELQRLANLSLKLSYWIRFAKWCKEHDSTTFNETRNSHYVYEKRYSLYNSIVERERLSDAVIDYLEFGVFEGNSLRWWLEANTHPASRFVGFDTFHGLPEDWGNVPMGTFTTEGKLPDVRDPRCTFEAGLFQHTLSPFLTRFHLGRRTVVHLDADLYTSTLFVLTTLGNYLKKGDFIFFDDFSSPTHEFRAFYDFASSFYVRYELSGTVNNHTQICIKLV